ncbi:hypothetical protein HAX54_017904 [Datura stramonium]|uniref:Uncharacterized protein n=1 Tax=Datura stramonium TaxID=4076 RepID=A0ABS8RJQ0_DATST|nr:hypothetical protein [Datura stramonium]
MAGFGREENDRGEGGAAAGAVVVVVREMKKKEGKKGVKQLPAVIFQRKIWGEGREGGPAMREKRESAAACCFSGVGDVGRTRRHGGFTESYGGYSVLQLGGSGVRRRGCWSQGRKGFPAKQWLDLVVGEERERGRGKEGCGG